MYPSTPDKEKIQEGQEEKKKLSCCSRCKRWCCRQLGKCCVEIWSCLCYPFKMCWDSICGRCKRGTKGFIRKHILPDTEFTFFGDTLRKIKSINENLRKSSQSLRKQSSVKPVQSKIKISDLTAKDIKSIENMKVFEANKKFSVTDSKLIILTEMIKDYKQGQILPGKGKFRVLRRKKLDKDRLNKLIQDYEEERKRADLAAIHENVKVLKNKFKLRKSQQQTLDKVVEDLQTADFSQVRTAKLKLEPDKVNKKDLEAMLKKYQEGKREKRGISFIISKARLGYNMLSKRRIVSLYDNIKIRLSEIVRDIDIKDIHISYPF